MQQVIESSKNRGLEELNEFFLPLGKSIFAERIQKRFTQVWWIDFGTEWLYSVREFDVHLNVEDINEDDFPSLTTWRNEYILK